MSNTNNHPKPHEKIIKAANNGELVVFLGAGASLLCGSPSWSGFAKSLVNELEAASAIQSDEAAELINLGDARRTLSVAKNMAERQKVIIDYDRILHPSQPHAIGLRLYSVLQRLQPVFVTTNYDKWLHRTQELETLDGNVEDNPIDKLSAYRDAEIFKPAHFTADKLSKPGAIIHLHGSYTEPSSMVISLRDYVRHYSDPSVIRFLTDMFKDFTVLFVGYGLAEMEILEQIIRVKGDVSNEGDMRHFILLSTRSNEAKQTEFTTEYFRDECGVGVLPYNVDNGYEAIVSVLENWSSQIEVKEANILELQRRIDKFLMEDTVSERRLSALSLVEQNPKLRAYLIANIQTAIWFEDLDRAHYFDVARIVGSNKKGELDTRKLGCPEILGYLEKICKSGHPFPSEKIVKILREITTYAKENGAHLWHSLWSCVRIISTLPVEHLNHADISLIETWFDNPNSDFLAMDLGNGLLKNLLASNDVATIEKSIQLVSLIIDYAIKNDTENYNGGSHLKDSIADKMTLFGERCGLAGVALLLAKLTKKIGTPEQDKNTYIGRRSIEPHEHDRYSESVLGTLIDSVRDALIGVGGSSTPQLNTQLEALLKSSYPTINRLGIFFATQFYDSVSKTFWHHCLGAWFSEPNCESEIYMLLQRRFADFDVRAKSRFLAIIVSLPGDWPADPRVDVWKDEHRRDLLARASAKDDEMFEELFVELVNKVGEPPAQLDPVPNNSIVWGGEESPLSPQQILSMSDMDLQKFMTDFTPTPHHFSGPSIRGFGQALSKAVQLSPDGYRGRLRIFYGANPGYIDALFSGLKERLSEDVSNFDWVEILQLGQLWCDGTSENEFSKKDDSLVPLEPTNNWVVGEISALIKTGLTLGKHPIPTELLPTAIQLLVNILGKLRPTLASESRDALTTAINSPYGKTLESIINALSATRRREKNADGAGIITQEVWGNTKPIFNSEIIKSNEGRNLEFSTLLGLYLPDLHWIDKDWVETNFNKVFSKENDDSWMCAANGFAYQNYQYEWLYKMLRQEGHLIRMLNLNATSNKIWRRAVQAVGLAFVNENEDIQDENGILNTLIRNFDEEALPHLCWYFWHISKSENKEKFTSHALQFWKKVDSCLIGNHNPIISQSLVQLCVYIDELDDESMQRWLRTLNSAGDERYSHEHIVLSEIARLVKISPDKILGIFDALIKKHLPLFNEKELKEIVRTFADKGFVNEAKEICIYYNEQGSHILDELYQEIRKM